MLYLVPTLSLITIMYYPSDDDESLTEIAAACVASEKELASFYGGTVGPSKEP